MALKYFLLVSLQLPRTLLENNMKMLFFLKEKKIQHVCDLFFLDC